MTGRCTMAGGQTQKGAHGSKTDETVTDAPQGAEVTEGLNEDVDSILDEIDEVLEENAEEFVRAFVQKGGQ